MSSTAVHNRRASNTRAERDSGLVIGETRRLSITETLALRIRFTGVSDLSHYADSVFMASSLGVGAGYSVTRLAKLNLPFAKPITMSARQVSDLYINVKTRISDRPDFIDSRFEVHYRGPDDYQVTRLPRTVPQVVTTPLYIGMS